MKTKIKEVYGKNGNLHKLSSLKYGLDNKVGGFLKTINGDFIEVTGNENVFSETEDVAVFEQYSKNETTWFIEN